ncbi:MAG: hypothetical protein HQL69_03370 [Magnetococcales bacterium]|nr:hypothetical protein [Magnetococcales bacterium]
MQDIITQLTLWLKKDHISSQIEEISLSTDWYRGGRKIGKLRREYKLIDTIDAKDEQLFSDRITAAHQTYMDRLALHKLKGPSNQQALRDAEISRNKLFTDLLNATVLRAKIVISEINNKIATYNDQNDKYKPDLATIAGLIKKLEIENNNKNNKIKYNEALLETLNSGSGFVGCSAEIKIIDINNSQSSDHA